MTDGKMAALLAILSYLPTTLCLIIASQCILANTTSGNVWGGILLFLGILTIPDIKWKYKDDGKKEKML